ncbi:MAG: DUF4105 domain-containing protein [Deltaproteobacteria bacterium]|nr:DUF4105 domain-containing protein [Deltaproteobacteria bacterium]
MGISQVHAQESPYLEEVLESAHQQKLHEDPYWHILLHYKTSARGSESLVDDPGFFLAPDGKTNPEAELEATIRAFFNPEDERKKSAVCRFVARYEWIKERLHLECNRLPVAECLPFQDFMNKIRPESVTLIFPMAHLNSPASMFGHTLLTIETANKSKLLAYAVSYSAVTDETFGPFFAVKGLFGLYPGYFSVLPYYAKLQEYSDVDHRDIWEYPLNLTEPEIRRMMLHIHELDHIASDYYFFNENCSYLLFFLLEAARPTVTLTDRFHGWLIPLDSIRMIEDQGFITDALYRPSRTTKIEYLASRIPEEGQDRALALARGEREGDFPASAAIPDQEKRKTCELAGEYLQYLYTKGKVPEEMYQERFLKILQARSRMGISKDESLYQILPPVQPDRGHHSNRFALGIGAKGDEFFDEIRLRPAYHHLMDSDDGYVKGAQLIFTDLTLRHYPSDHKLTLEGLDVIDIVSLSPRDKFFHPISWKIKTGFTRIQGEDDEDHLVYEVNPGGGFAFENVRTGLMYGMLETNLNISGGLKHKYAAGAGGSVGIIRHMSEFWKVHLFVRDLSYGLGDRSNVLEAAMQQNFAITPDRSISVELKREKSHRFYQTEAKALVNLFF